MSSQTNLPKEDASYRDPDKVPTKRQVRAARTKIKRQYEEKIAGLRVATSDSIAYNRSMARIRIRLAASRDWNVLAEMRYRFRAELGSTTEPKSRFVRRFTSWMGKRFDSGSSTWRYWVADDGKQLLGHVCVQLFQKMPNPVNEPELHAYLTNLYVVPEMRSHGLGKRLLNKALSWCRAQGVDAVILWASPGSRSLYRRCGLGQSADLFELRCPKAL